MKTLPDGAGDSYCSQSRRGQVSGVFQVVLGAAAIAGSFFTAGATLQHGGQPLGPVYDRHPVFSVPVWCSVVWRRCWHRKPELPATQTTDNGKQNTYFSSLDNMVAQAMFCRFCTVKCAWGHAWFLRDQQWQTKGMVVRLW